MRHAVVTGKTASRVGVNIRDQIQQAIIINTLERRTCLFLQRTAHGTTRIVHLHDGRHTFPDSREIMFGAVGLNRTQGKIARRSQNAECNGAVPRIFQKSPPVGRFGSWRWLRCCAFLCLL